MTISNDPTSPVNITELTCGLAKLALEVEASRKQMVSTETKLHHFHECTSLKLDRQLACIQQGQEQIEALLLKILMAQTLSLREHDVLHASVILPTGQSQSKATHALSRVPHIPRGAIFDGTACRLISWLDKLDSWLQKSELDGLDDLLVGSKPLMMHFLKGSALIWFEETSESEPFISFKNFYNRLLEYVFDYDWSPDIERSTERQTNVKCYKELIMYLKKNGILVNFLINAKIAIVEEVMAEVEGENSDYLVSHSYVVEALTLSLYDTLHDRAIDLFIAIQMRYAEEDESRISGGNIPVFEHFMDEFMAYFLGGENIMSLKRFLTFQSEKLAQAHPILLETFCLSLVYRLRSRLDIPEMEKLLVDLIGQPALLPTISFAKAFLDYNNNDPTIRVNFLEYGWREAIELGLKGGYAFGGESLWEAMRVVFSGQLSPQYPPSNGTLEAILGRFPTKRELEERWRRANAPRIVRHVGEFVPELPTLPLNIVSKYVVTWLDI
jgi:hypothetical protein